MGLIEMIEKQARCEIVVQRKGVGLETPTEGSICRVRLKRSQQDAAAVIADDEKEIIIGEGDNQLCETWDNCLSCMHQEEIWQVKVHSSHDHHQEENNPNSCSLLTSTVLFELELLSFTKAKEVWQTSSEEKLQLAVHHKARGTDCYKEKRWLDAARRYSKALKQLILMKGKVPDEQLQEYNHLKLSCHLNLAACQGRLQQYDYVVQNCTKVLTMDTESIKGLYRRGQALLMLNEFVKAKEDLETALKLEPANRAVQEQLAFLREKERQQDAAYTKALASMFGRT